MSVCKKIENQLVHLSSRGIDNSPIATTEIAGKVKPDGTTITVTQDGTISAATQEVPIATTSITGKVKPDGTTITVTQDGTISAATQNTPIATSNTLGIVKPDNSTIKISNGILSIDSSFKKLEFLTKCFQSRASWDQCEVNLSANGWATFQLPPYDNVEINASQGWIPFGITRFSSAHYGGDTDYGIYCVDIIEYSSGGNTNYRASIGVYNKKNSAIQLYYNAWYVYATFYRFVS